MKSISEEFKKKKKGETTHDLVSYLDITTSRYVVSIVKRTDFSLGLFFEIQFYTLNFHTSTTYVRRKAFKCLAKMKSFISGDYFPKMIIVDRPL